MSVAFLTSQPLWLTFESALSPSTRGLCYHAGQGLLIRPGDKLKSFQRILMIDDTG